ncbi:MAG: GerW family sporulation protein [Oscillospiraceae bacterium]|jgi:uncharacterized spore protein YtfJ
MQDNSKDRIGAMLETAIGKMKEAVGGDMVVGNQIKLPNGASAVPVSMIQYAFGGGGTDLPNKNSQDLFGGGVGGGCKVVPIAFLICTDSGVRVVQLSENVTPVDSVLQTVPEVIDKIVSLIGKKDKQDENPDGEDKI